jgi:hypothetical protein
MIKLRRIIILCEWYLGKWEGFIIRKWRLFWLNRRCCPKCFAPTNNFHDLGFDYDYCTKNTEDCWDEEGNKLTPNEYWIDNPDHERED